MPVESATFISQLDPTYPTGSEVKSQGDNHLRLIKFCLDNTFPNFTAIAMNASTVELNYSVGLTGIIQTQLDSKVGANSPALTGTPTAPTASIGTNTTQIATTAFVISQVATGTTPAGPGDAGKFWYYTGSSYTWMGVTQPEQQSRTFTTADTAIVSDRQKVLEFTGSSNITLAFTAAATLTNGWFVYVKNSTAFKLTLDPNGAETIDGLATIIVYPGETRMVRCTGTAFLTFRVSGDPILVVRDEKTSGTGGGTPAAATWQTRDLNTTQVNTLGAAVASNNVTFDPGTYYIEASAPGYGVNQHKIRLYSVTASAILLLGTSEAAPSSTATRSVVKGQLTFSVATTIRVEQYFALGTTGGMGLQTSQGTEVYAELTARRLN